MSARLTWACMLALALARPGVAAVLDFAEEATLAADRQHALASLRLPVGPFDGQSVPAIRTEGGRSDRVWHQPLQGRTTLQILAPLRAQLLAQDFQVIYACADTACGGFDFRFATEIWPEPEMHVDLGDYHYLAARRLTGGAPEYAMLVVSRSALRAFVQVTRITPGPDATSTSPGTPAAIPPDPAAATDDTAPALIAKLEQDGHVLLDDLVFATGAAALQAGPFGSLDALADYLRADPGRSVVLVGHTDTEGGLSGNIALSKQRADAVRRHLIETLDVPAGQVAAEGVGYLAPRASNLTDAGRRLNRRVEAVLLGTE